MADRVETRIRCIVGLPVMASVPAAHIHCRHFVTVGIVAGPDHRFRPEVHRGFRLPDDGAARTGKAGPNGSDPMPAYRPLHLQGVVRGIPCRWRGTETFAPAALSRSIPTIPSPMRRGPCIDRSASRLERPGNGPHLRMARILGAGHRVTCLAVIEHLDALIPDDARRPVDDR